MIVTPPPSPRPSSRGLVRRHDPWLDCSSLGAEAAEEPVVARVGCGPPARVDMHEHRRGARNLCRQPLDRSPAPQRDHDHVRRRAGGMTAGSSPAETPDGLDVVVQDQLPLHHLRHQGANRQTAPPGQGPPLAPTRTSATRSSKRASRPAGGESSGRLQDRGFADARVDAYLNYNRKTNAVAVEFEVDTGTAAGGGIGTIGRARRTRGYQ